MSVALEAERAPERPWAGISNHIFRGKETWSHEVMAMDSDISFLLRFSWVIRLSFMPACQAEGLTASYVKAEMWIGSTVSLRPGLVFTIQCCDLLVLTPLSYCRSGGIISQPKPCPKSLLGGC